MRLILIAMIACSSLLHGFDDPITKKTMELAREADIVVNYGTDGQLDIGVGALNKEGRYKEIVDFSFDELVRFFDKQKHKNLVVVVIAKNAWTQSKIKSEVIKLRDYFIARGYKRISIQQASGGGRGEHLDYTKQAQQDTAPDS